MDTANLITLDPVDYRLKSYEFDYDSSNPHWALNPAYNKLFLTGVHNHMNNRLKIVGWVFLNEYLKELGIGTIGEGQLVGWHESCGMAFVDAKMRHKNEHDASLILTFTVDGLIYDKI